MEAILFYFYVALAAIFLPLSQCVNPPLIEQTCKQTPYFSLCVNTLNSDPRSKTAGDVKTLALIMVDSIKAKATEALQQIQELKKQHPELQGPLNDCSDKYNAVINGDVPQAIEALEKGDPKFAVDATNDAALEANSCEGSFSGKSPMTQVNNLNHDISIITASIVKISMSK